MISGQLGSAQSGLAQLGAYDQLITPGGTPPVTPLTVGLIDASELNFQIIPDYYVMMGLKPPKGEL